MTNLNYNRPMYRKGKEVKVEEGNKPVIHSNTMKFGKYKGYDLRDIPTDYLEWLISVSDDSVALKYCRELINRPKYKL